MSRKFLSKKNEPVEKTRGLRYDEIITRHQTARGGFLCPGSSMTS
jgi:hypothetical protein